MSDTIKLPQEKWEYLCSKIDNEGFGYFVMIYIGVDGFSEYVDGDKKAVELFTAAQKSMSELSDYLKLDEF